MSDPWRVSLRELQSDGDGYRADVSLQISQVLAVLQPTDDPDMLGRIGSYEVSGVIGGG